ncbi:hypothetical protein Tco_0158211 [Tanacetum coccineum]
MLSLRTLEGRSMYVHEHSFLGWHTTLLCVTTGVIDSFSLSCSFIGMSQPDSSTLLRIVSGFRYRLRRCAVATRQLANIWRAARLKLSGKCALEMMQILVDPFSALTTGAKERSKIRSPEILAQTIHSSIKDRILEAQSEAFKGANTPTKMLKELDKQFKRKEDG